MKMLTTSVTMAITPKITSTPVKTNTIHLKKKPKEFHVRKGRGEEEGSNCFDFPGDQSMGCCYTDHPQLLRFAPLVTAVFALLVSIQNNTQKKKNNHTYLYSVASVNSNTMLF